MKPQEHKSSDISQILSGITQMYDSLSDLRNIYARSSMMLAITLEARTLSRKLQLMQARWQKHLPFREASDVSFDYWAGVTDCMARELMPVDGSMPALVSRRTASPNFLLDLWDQLPGQASSESITDPSELLQHRRSRHYEISSRYAECLQRISSQIAGEVMPDGGQDFFSRLEPESQRRLCAESLSLLSSCLMKLHETINRRFSVSELRRLATRVMSEYGGEGLEAEARREVANWQNTTSPEDLIIDGQTSIMIAREDIFSGHIGQRLRNHLGEDREPDLEQYKDRFGRFLVTCRGSLTLANLRRILRDYYLIREYQACMAGEEENGGQAESENTYPLAPDDPEPWEPVLPRIFSEPLRLSEKATQAFLKELARIEPYVNATFRRKNLSQDVVQNIPMCKWCHVKDALEESGLMLHATQDAFGEFMNLQFPHRTVGSITRALDVTRADKQSYHSVVHELRAMFEAAVTPLL